MDKRYQVFISSTYTDLKEERKAVMQALMEMDCIPAGMEMFPATDEEQFEFIKKIIDDCDYYLLIIGGRYGSIAPDGLSYTEKEFDYAVSKGVKVVALIHGSPDSIPQGKSEITSEAIEKLKLFRKKASTGRLIKYWQETKELPGLVALSLQKTIKMFPSTGWVRADKIAREDLLSETNDLRKQNKELSEQLAKSKLTSTVKDIADIDSEIEVGLCWREGDEFPYKMTWREIFTIISPEIKSSIPETSIEKVITSYMFSDFDENTEQGIDNFKLNFNFVKQLRIQFMAYNLIRAIDTMGITSWSLTDKGKQFMLECCAVKAN